MVNNISTQQFIPNMYLSWRTGRTALPVNPALSVYAHFKHVVGIPSTNAQAQVPLSKLQLLDMLIERLTEQQTNVNPAKTAPFQQKITADNIEAKIKILQQELSRSLQTSKPIFTGQFNTQAGLLLNVYA